MKIGGNSITAAYLGSTPVIAAYLGAVRVFGAPAAEIIHDTFTTASTTEPLLSHTTDSGTTWIIHSQSINLNPPIINGATDRCYSPGVAANGRQVFYTAADPDDANYVVEADLDMVTTVTGEIIGVVGRCNVSLLTMYYARYSVAAGIQLFKIVNGNLTQLGSNFATTFANGSTNTISLVMNGTAISVEVNGVQRIAVTDGSITAKGKAGIAIYRDTGQSPTTGLQYTAFRALVRTL